MVTRLEALARQAQAGPSADLGEAWKAFAADLEAHLALYEGQVMARAHRGLAQREHARRIAQEHAATRALVEEIGRQFAIHRPRPESLDLLAEILRERVGPDGKLRDEVDALS